MLRSARTRLKSAQNMLSGQGVDASGLNLVPRTDKPTDSTGTELPDDFRPVPGERVGEVAGRSRGEARVCSDRKRSRCAKSGRKMKVEDLERIARG